MLRPVRVRKFVGLLWLVGSLGPSRVSRITRIIWVSRDLKDLIWLVS